MYGWAVARTRRLLALSGWVPDVAPDCRRHDAALRCAEGGWALADALLSRHEAACAGRVPSGASPPSTDVPRTTPEVPRPGPDVLRPAPNVPGSLRR